MRSKRVIFRVVLVAVALVLASSSAEFVLRQRLATKAAEEHLDGGLFRYDSRLGWRLAPSWQGRHRHHDYDVSYGVGPDGFRHDPAVSGTERDGLDLVLGDSFTFALGVNDDETFLHLLNKAEPGPPRYRNLAIPGYSTDQELLLLEETLPSARPQRVYLCVYLGNDLIDNQRPFPIQADNGKPYFDVEDDGLQLRNAPVPPRRKNAGDPGFDLPSELLAASRPWLYRTVALFNQRELTRPAAQWVLRGVGLDDEFRATLSGSLRLFAALVDRAQSACQDRGAQLVLVLMPGRSFVERPCSLSARYQEAARKSIVDLYPEGSIRLVDLATALGTARRGGTRDLFHPYDGHLSPDGHAVVADLLADHL